MIILNAMDCQMVYRKALVENYPRSKSFLGPKLERFERLAHILTLNMVQPEEYIPFVFSAWEGLYPPSPETLANPLQFQHYRKMQVK